MRICGESRNLIWKTRDSHLLRRLLEVKGAVAGWGAECKAERAGADENNDRISRC